MRQFNNRMKTMSSIYINNQEGKAILIKEIFLNLIGIRRQLTKEWRVILYTHKQRVNANQNHDWATKHE